MRCGIFLGIVCHLPCCLPVVRRTVRIAVIRRSGLHGLGKAGQDLRCQDLAGRWLGCFCAAWTGLAGVALWLGGDIPSPLRQIGSAAFILALWLLLLPAVSRHRAGVAMAGMALLILGRLLLAEDFLPRASFLNIVGLAKHLGAIWPVLGLGWLVMALTRRSASPSR